MNKTNTYIVRKGGSEDLHKIALLHAESWQTSYKELLTPEYLKIIYEERQQYWLQKINQLSDEDFILIVENDKQIVGFACVIMNKDNYDALLDNLHIHPLEKGKRIGSLLLSYVISELVKYGKTNFYLWVFEKNRSAIQFYNKMKGTAMDSSIVHFNGVNLKQIRYVWNDIIAWQMK